MSEVRTLTLAAPAPCTEVVERLRELLERAERGEVLGLAVVAEFTGREIGSTVVRGEGGSIFTLLGGVHELAFRICREEIQQPP